MKPESPTSNEIKESLPPDIVQTILPYLTSKDIKNLSLTNKYFNKLLDYSNSSILWHELFRKSFGNTYTNDEPFISKNSKRFQTCSETILLNTHAGIEWDKLYNLRKYRSAVFTWGCIKHGRLGYTISSNSRLSADSMNQLDRRITFGVCKPVEVPWMLHSVPISGRANSWDDDDTEEETNVLGEYDRSIVQISGGGFSFQILTQSGKLYSTGATYHGGHNGPGPLAGQHDFQPIDETIRSLERSFPLVHGPFRVMGSIGDPIRIQNPHHTTNLTGTFRQHEDIYADLMKLSDISSKCLPGNDQVRRMLPKSIFNVKDPKDFDESMIDSVRFVAVSSGRSHFLALDDKNDLYSWDGREVNHGVKLIFNDLPMRSTNPILKISCGWNCNCIFIYGVGLVVWKSRDATVGFDGFANAHYKVIPNTGEVNGTNKIVDFACGSDNAVFYITNDGEKLWLYSNEIEKYIDLPIEGKMVKVQTSNNTLAIFTSDTCYTVEIKDGEVAHNTLTKIEIAPNVKIISLSFGDYHGIALSDTGDMYTWGLESEMCGCLGLGKPESIVSRGAGTFERARSIRVQRPTKVDIDGTCVAITAGGWQSGAIIIKD
ncbi:Saf1 [Kluyveromyces lactis]|nr:Saf1 [Kluyveromyces lactis]